MSLNPSFEHPSIDWAASDLYKEFTRFEDHVGFVFSGPLSALTPQQKAGWLGTWIGSHGREVYRTLDWKEGEKEDPDKVLAKFSAYVRPRKNKRIARHKLKQRKQTSMESFDQFLTDLRLIIMDCDYKDPDDILIDCIIDGVSDTKVQERLLDRGESLTLPKAIEICQQYETSKKQVRIVRDEDEDPSICALRAKPKLSGTPTPNQGGGSRFPKQPGSLTSTSCLRCGGDPKHSRSGGRCPAIGTTCSYCKKPNHWLKVCLKRKKELHSLTIETESSLNDSDQEILSIHMTSSNQPGQDKWNQNLDACGVKLTFKIDTGARCNTVTVQAFQEISDKCELRKSTRILRTYSNHLIHPVGSADITLSHNSIQLTETFEVVDLQQENVISGATAEKLGLLSRLSSVHTTSLTHEFPELSNMSGTFPGEYSIKLKPGAVGVIHGPRRQPAALKYKIVDKLHEMEANEQIKKVDEPTEWVSSMTVAVKGDKVRICLDPRDLNNAIQREHYPMKTIEEIVSEIPNAKVFSTLDAKNGFLQIKLDTDSSYLTTFNTPLGRYRWLRLPFGVSCAPEVFQRIMDRMLAGISGAHAVIDDILIAAETMEEHDKILRQVVQRATEYNLKLNFEKTRLRQPQVTYVGHVLTPEGLKPDPEKVRAVQGLPRPATKDDVRRFLGFVTYLGKFLPNLSAESLPLRQLLRDDADFVWEDPQEKAFQRLKNLCCQCPVLRYFDVAKPVEIQSDASSRGLGAVLLQDGHPVAYASRALSDTEQRYAQIEKEMLSIVFACKKFHCYIFGKPTMVFNDHKPLEMIFKKPLHSAPMRLQRMLLALQWYDLQVSYRKGKDMDLPDTLSRAFLPDEEPDALGLGEADINAFVTITKDKYLKLQRATEKELPLLCATILSGWPTNRNDAPESVRPYWDSRAELSVSDGIVLKGTRLVIPPSMRCYILSLIHGSHLGIVKCKQRAREVVYWPGMNAEIEDNIKHCPNCSEVQNQQQKQPLMPTPHPSLPFQEVSCDIFDCDGSHYLVTVDFYSRYILVNKLRNLQSSSVINALRQIICIHGIPETIRSDCGSQFMCQEFQTFCGDLGMVHTPVSPHYQKANGLSERAVQTVKRLWKKGADKYMSLLDYNTTPLDTVNLSPAQLLMGRRPRNLLPSTKSLLRPQQVDPTTLKKHFAAETEKQKFYHDRHATKPLLPLEPGQHVRVKPLPGQKNWFPATVVAKHKSPRSYVVESGGRRYRRNRQHIRESSQEANTDTVSPPNDPDFLDDIEAPPPASTTPDLQVEVPDTGHSIQAQPPLHPADTGTYTTRLGRTVRRPERLDL